MELDDFNFDNSDIVKINKISIEEFRTLEDSAKAACLKYMRLDSIAVVKKKQDKIRDSLARQADLLRMVKSGLVIITNDFYGDDHSAVFVFSYINYSGKILKYAYITLNFYNPVDDIIATKTVTAVGPVSHENAGTYKFENVNSRVFDWGEIERIKIQYTDGSTKTYTKAQIKSLVYKDQ